MLPDPFRSIFEPRDINIEMVTKVAPVRAVNLSIGPFCTEFRRDHFRDDDDFWDRDQFFDDFRSISDRFPIDFRSISGRFPVDFRANFTKPIYLFQIQCQWNIFVSKPILFRLFCNQYIGLWYPYSRGQTNTNIPYSFQTNTNIE